MHVNCTGIFSFATNVDDSCVALIPSHNITIDPRYSLDLTFKFLHSSGTRAEHITDLLNVPRRVHANKIHVAVSALCRISAGSLPPAARWLTRTRLCWQRKKNGKPWPFKMGELLRSAYAERLVNQQQVVLRSKALRMHQCGISLLGACERRCHRRGTIEPMVANGSLELVAAIWNLLTCLATLSGRASVRLCARISQRPWPGPLGGTSLTLVISLPTGATFATNRGAEQGDVLGTIQSALVLGRARDTSLGEFFSSSLKAKGVCDVWFVEDGHVFARPWSFDPWLRAADAALASSGAT